MSSSNPPYPYYNGIPFNPSFFTSNTGTGLSESTANTLYLRKTVADTASAQETFSLGIKAQKVDGLLSSSIMYVGNNITSGSLILGNTGIRTKNQGIFEAYSIRTPATNGQLAICTDLVAGGSVEIGSVNGTVNLSASSSGGVNVPTSAGVSTNAVNVAYLTTALTNVATVNQVQTFTQTNTFNNATAGIKADIIAGVATTGTQSLYATKTAGTLNIATSQTSGGIYIGGTGSGTVVNGSLNVLNNLYSNFVAITSNPADSTTALQFQRNGQFTIGVAATANPKLVMGVATGSSPGTEVQIASLTVNGAVYSNGGTLTNTNPSDETLKKNIRTLEVSIDKLNPVEYEWINPKMGAGVKYGFLANEVVEIFPSICSSWKTDEEDEADGIPKIKLGMDTVSLIPIMISSMKKMKLDYDAKLSKLEERLLALETKPDSI